MIQIRKKKEQQRQSIRRQFLDNYFREMRKNCFHFQNSTQPIQTIVPGNELIFQGHDSMTHEISVFEFLLSESLKFNCLAQRIRQSALLDQLKNLTEQAIKAQSLFEVKFLLTIISNALKDELEVDEKNSLYQLSATLFQSLRISHIDQNEKSSKDHFEKIMQILRPETLVFYMLTANQSSQYLDEQDQIKIQQQIYPAFTNVLMNAVHYCQKIANLEEFQNDVGRFFNSIFDAKDADYEQGNRMKAQRLLPFYEDIFKGHLWLLDNSEHFENTFAKAQLFMFKSYTKLAQILGDLPEFMIGKEIFRIMNFTLRESSRNQKESRLNFVFSLLQIFISKNILNQYTEEALYTKDNETDTIVFERAIKLVMENSIVRYRALQLIETVIILFFQEALFKHLVQNYEIQLIDMCAFVLSRFDKSMIGQSKQRKMLFRAISIMRIFVEKENIIGNNRLVKRFDSHFGGKALEYVSKQFHEVDVGEDMEISQSLEYIEIILQAININIDIEIEPMKI